MNKKLLQIIALWSAGLVLVAFAFWLCWQGFMVDYLGERPLSLGELLSLFGLVAFVVGVVVGVIELVADRT